MEKLSFTSLNTQIFMTPSVFRFFLSNHHKLSIQICNHNARREPHLSKVAQRLGMRQVTSPETWVEQAELLAEVWNDIMGMGAMKKPEMSSDPNSMMENNLFISEDSWHYWPDWGGESVISNDIMYLSEWLKLEVVSELSDLATQAGSVGSESDAALSESNEDKSKGVDEEYLNYKLTNNWRAWHELYSSLSAEFSSIADETSPEMLKSKDILQITGGWLSALLLEAQVRFSQNFLYHAEFDRHTLLEQFKKGSSHVNEDYFPKLTFRGEQHQWRKNFVTSPVAETLEDELLRLYERFGNHKKAKGRTALNKKKKLLELIFDVEKAVFVRYCCDFQPVRQIVDNPSVIFRSEVMGAYYEELTNTGKWEKSHQKNVKRFETLNTAYAKLATFVELIPDEERDAIPVTPLFTIYKSLSELQRLFNNDRMDSRTFIYSTEEKSEEFQHADMGSEVTIYEDGTEDGFKPVRREREQHSTIFGHFYTNYCTLADLMELFEVTEKPARELIKKCGIGVFEMSNKKKWYFIPDVERCIKEQTKSAGED